MLSLEEWYQDLVIDSAKPEEIIFNLIIDQFLKWNIVLTDTQKLHIKIQLKKDPIENFTIDVSDAQEELIRNAGFNPQELSLDFNNIDYDKIIEGIENEFSEIISKATYDYSDKLIKSWKKQSRKVQKVERKYKNKVNKKINSLWGIPLNKLEMLISISRQLGSDFNDSNNTKAVEENDFIFEVLRYLHGRACQIGYEILLLLNNGFADGAYARWRTLHEISVIAEFIASHDQQLAKRYLDHHVITDCMEAEKYQEKCRELGLEPLDKNLLDELHDRRDILLADYEKSFKEDNGWASIIFGHSPTFSEIEAKIKLDHIRPFYKSASNNIHAGSKGTLYRIGNKDDQNLILAGPSIFGLNEPGRHTAFSIGFITSAFLAYKPSLDRIAYLRALEKLRNETCWAFDEINGESF